MSSPTLRQLRSVYGNVSRFPFIQFAINSSVVLALGFVAAMTLSGGA